MTLSAAENRRLTEVGKSTPMGDLLRHYWFPVAVADGWKAGEVRPFELLGDRYVLFLSNDADWAALDERCPHRGTSLAYGMVEDRGLRCSYHGWLFGRDGACLDMPNEDPTHGFKDRVRQPAYPVREQGGLLFAYLGPRPAPPLPAYDVLAAEDARTPHIRTAIIPCNWLQIVENTLDPAHLEWLHGHFANHHSRQQGGSDLYDVARHSELGFDIDDLGIVKRRLIEGQDPAEEDWSIGQLFLFPATMYVSNRNYTQLQFRVPLDNTRTWHVWYERRADDDAVAGTTTVTEADILLPDGSFDLGTIDGQDVMAWVTQGAIADRTRERLGAADKGITLLRQQFFEQMAAVERGERPRWADHGSEVIPLPRRSEGRSILRELPVSSEGAPVAAGELQPDHQR